jgi:DNA invertase Pin-like site-specific DNA recombinase
MGYEVVWVFNEPCTSGKGSDIDPSPEAWYIERPNLYEAINKLTPGMVLLVTKRDRIGRSAHGQGIVRMDVARHGCKIEAADEPNGEAPENRLTQNLLAVISEYERMLIVARILAGMHRGKKNGHRMTRAERIQYGFQLDPENNKRVIPEPYEQENIALALAFKEANPKATGYAICRYLDSIGRTRRGGKSWANSSRLASKIVKND